MSYPEAFWLNMDSPAEVVMALAFRCEMPDEPVFSQVAIGPYRVDFLIPWYADLEIGYGDGVVMPGLVVEVDGFSFHSTEDQFEADRRRDRDLAARDKTVIRFSAREVFADPLGCAREVKAVIEAREERHILNLLGRGFIDGLLKVFGHRNWSSADNLDVVANEIDRLNKALVA